MRHPSITLLLIGAALAAAPMARAQSVAAAAPSAPPAASQQAAARVPAGTARSASANEAKGAHRARSAPKRRAPATGITGAPARAPAGAAGGVLDLGATDITGNKELPKVMVIVPWKDSLAAGGVIKPTDSLLDDVLQPVDRGVFQRQIRYYGQIGSTAQPPAPARVAPVGDSR